MAYSENNTSPTAPAALPRIVWITGAGSGIGRAMALAFGGRGDHVVLSGRRKEPLEAVAGEIAAAGSGTAEVAVVDVCDRAGLERVAAGIVANSGRIDVLCNNAGLNIPDRRWADLDWPSWDRVIDINVTGAMNVIAAVLPAMRAQGDGLILNTSSWAGRFHSEAGGVPYGASKHALMALNASLNAEEGPNGIRATALCPGAVATPLMTRRPGYRPEMAATMIQPEDLAALALTVADMNPNVAVQEITLAPRRRKED